MWRGVRPPRGADVPDDVGVSGIDWDHNSFYHRLLLRQLPPRCLQALDVGCGSGNFAAKLAGRVEHVDALDRSPVMIDAARAVTPGNVTCLIGDFLRYEFADESYDAIFSLSALHHMALEDALPRMVAALRPGGVLAAIALPRIDLPREIPIELVAAPGYRLLGLAFVAARRAGHGQWYQRESGDESMPIVLDPPLTTRSVRTTATTNLPGVRVRRLVFWRYLLTWQKPTRAARSAGVGR
jgi:SAM-dependent methyltransferase